MTGVAMSLCTSRPIVTPAEPQLRELLGLRDAEPVVAAGAAVLLGVVRAEDAELAGALEDLVREELGLLPLVGVRRELLLGELADGLAELVVLLAERAGHAILRTRNIANCKTRREAIASRYLICDGGAMLLTAGISRSATRRASLSSFVMPP